MDQSVFREKGNHSHGEREKGKAEHRLWTKIAAQRSSLERAFISG
jgi:hypothetical protein